MKLNKKTKIALSFTIGACVFVSTAFADSLLSSGYEMFKGSIKNTAAQLEHGVNNYTFEALVTMKHNDQSLAQLTMYNKLDTVNQAIESSAMAQYANGVTTNDYSYLDKNVSIWKRSNEDKYYLTEFAEGQNNRELELSGFSNPFEQNGAQEMEKIVDALVGNLKEYVQAQESADGRKIYSGTLTQAQVPALVNAVSSFAFKEAILKEFSRDHEGNISFPAIDNDIHVSKVSGTAIENKNGMLENLKGEVVVSGKDKAGAQHDLSFEVVLSLADIGSTKIVKPDLTGKEVEKVAYSRYDFSITPMHVGKYRNNIVIEKDGEFVKIGERTLEIVSVDNGLVKGKYEETVKAGFEAEFGDIYSFTFEMDQNNPEWSTSFIYTKPNGEQGNGLIHTSNSGKLYVELYVDIIDKETYHVNSRENFDSEFDRVFEE